MSPSRRHFLALAGAGAATAGVAAATAAIPAAGAAPVTLPADASGGLVAHVNDVATGEVSLLVGDDEVVVHDRELVARLARASRKA